MPGYPGLPLPGYPGSPYALGVDGDAPPEKRFPLRPLLPAFCGSARVPWPFGRGPPADGPASSCERSEWSQLPPRHKS
eukprot:1123191-Prorocentrum_minimum.AAC.1